jgi:predicted metal-dependent hydrolase
MLAMSAQLSLLNEAETAMCAESRVMFSIRESRRARRLILQAVPPRTVEVVVPRGMRPASIRAFVRDHHDWIARASAELIAAYPDEDLQPEVIDLKATGERLTLRYLTGTAGGSSFRRAGSELRLRGAGPASWQALLRRWLLAQGGQVLKPWLRREAIRTGLTPSRVQVRLQKTRWGSCSARGSVSLNAALLLVPPELVRYLMVHELCHLQHLNHSRRYWQAVARHEPGFRELDRRLAACWRELPAWVLALD